MKQEKTKRESSKKVKTKREKKTGKWWQASWSYTHKDAQKERKDVVQLTRGMWRRTSSKVMRGAECWWDEGEWVGVEETEEEEEDDGEEEEEEEEREEEEVAEDGEENRRTVRDP